MNSTLALTVRQPWAELILRGEKRIEVRSWPTSHRGLLWIHAAKAKNEELVKAHGLEEPLPRGAYVGAAMIASVVPLDIERWKRWHHHHLAGPYMEGQYGWVLTDPLRFAEPIPGPGRLRLFEPPSSVATQLQHALDKARA